MDRRTGAPLARAVRVVCMIVVLLGLATQLTGTSFAQAGANWWDTAAQDTRDQLTAVKDSVGQTIEKLDGAREKLDDLENWARGNLQGADLQRVLDRVTNARNALDAHMAPLKVFDKRMGQVTSGIDAVFELKDLADAARQRRGGELAASLHILATAMEKYGEKVPFIGDAIAAYGQVTKGILDATDQIAQTIESNRNQGMFGLGTY